MRRPIAKNVSQPKPLASLILTVRRNGQGLRHHVLTNPVYAGAYTYGKTRQETTLGCGWSGCGWSAPQAHTAFAAPTQERIYL
jgi:hypothetical protein